MEEKKEKEEKIRKKDNTGILLIIIIILIILLGACAFMLYQEKSNKNTTDTEERETKKQDTEETQKDKFNSISLEDELVTRADNLNPKAACGQTTLELVKRNRTVNEISSIEKIRMLSSCGALKKIGTQKATISEENIKKYFEDTSFLEKYANGLPQGESLGYIAYTDIRYENGQLEYINPSPVGCEGPAQGSFLKLYSAKKNSKRLVLNYVTYYTQADREEQDESGYNFVFKYYKDETKADYIGEGREYKELDASLFPGYQFVYNIEDSNCRLEEINYLPLITEG